MTVTGTTLGTDHPSFSALMQDLAGVLRQQVKAEVSCRTMGDLQWTHASAETLLKVSSAPTLLQGKYEKAESLYCIASTMKEARVGTDDAQHALDLGKKAVLWEEQVKTHLSSWTRCVDSARSLK